MENYQKESKEIREMDYPSLKNRIEEQMVEKYGIDEGVAERFICQEEVTKLIERDIIWSQIMGAGYWAKEFAEILLLPLEDEIEKKST